MFLKPNIGTLNALLRITFGFTILSFGTANLIQRSRRGFNNMSILTVMMGAMKVAEGITRFCPLVYVYEERLDEDYEDMDETEITPPLNPS